MRHVGACALALTWTPGETGPGRATLWSLPRDCHVADGAKHYDAAPAFSQTQSMTAFSCATDLPVAVSGGPSQDASKFAVRIDRLSPRRHIWVLLEREDDVMFEVAQSFQTYLTPWAARDAGKQLLRCGGSDVAHERLRTTS